MHYYKLLSYRDIESCGNPSVFGVLDGLVRPCACESKFEATLKTKQKIGFLKKIKHMTLTTKMTFRLTLLTTIVITNSYLNSANNCFAQTKPKAPTNNEQISQEQLSGAMGHFSRAKSLLNSAIMEFEKGKSKYDPSALIDTIEWKAVLVQKAKELETVLAPKPRESETGIKYDGDNRLLNKN